MPTASSRGEIVAKLSPGGIRQKKLAEAISSFNARLKTLSRQAGWISRGEPADVQIDSDLQPSYGEWQYRFLSESAR